MYSTSYLNLMITCCLLYFCLNFPNIPLYIIPTPTDFSNAILMDFINDRVEFLLEVMVFSHWAKKRRKKWCIINSINESKDNQCSCSGWIKEKQFKKYFWFAASPKYIALFLSNLAPNFVFWGRKPLGNLPIEIAKFWVYITSLCMLKIVH